MCGEVPTDESKPEHRAPTLLCQSREVYDLESMLYTYICALQVASLYRLCAAAAEDDCAVHTYSFLIPYLHFHLQ